MQTKEFMRFKQGITLVNGTIADEGTDKKDGCKTFFPKLPS